jgi:type II secretory pathway component GspD/PulD (secretin)
MKPRICLNVLWALAVSAVLFVSCTPSRHQLIPVAGETRTQGQLSVSPAAFMSVDSTLHRADKLYGQGDYEGAAAVLKAAGKQGYSYYRIDEILYRLGKCNIELRHPARAERCFRLLKTYYPVDDNRFPDLGQLVLKAEQLRREYPEDENLGSLAAGDTTREKLSAPGDTGVLVTNVYFETDIRQVLADLSAQTGISIVADPLAQGYVTAEVKRVPLEQALEQTLLPLGLVFKKMDGYYLVGASSIESPSFPTLAETRYLELKYLKVDEALKLLPKYYTQYLNADEKANAMTISAPHRIVENLRRELAALDAPRRQFMIEAAVVEMGDEARRMLGIDWDWTGTKDNDGLRISKLLPVMRDSSFLGELVRIDKKSGNITYDLRVALRALAASGKADIKANPKVTTQDGHEATIRLGREAYYSLIRGSLAYPYVTLEKIATGITLRITPYIGDSPEITSDVFVEVSDVTGEGADKLPVTSVRSVQTKVTVGNGQTFGLGGLVLERTTRERNRVPLLGDIPILGWLFGTTDFQKEQTEVVILITPHVLISPEEFDSL